MNIIKKIEIDVFDDDIKPGMVFKLTTRHASENIIVMRVSSDRTYLEYVRIVIRNGEHYIDTCYVSASDISSGDTTLTPLVPASK